MYAAPPKVVAGLSVLNSRLQPSLLPYPYFSIALLAVPSFIFASTERALQTYRVQEAVFPCVPRKCCMYQEADWQRSSSNAARHTGGKCRRWFGEDLMCVHSLLI